jgi:3-oxoacyl-[acyl-carrier-protein] synthase-3
VLTVGERGFAIRGIRYRLPAHTVTNDDLSEIHPDWNMRLIESKTGVKSRHIASESELASDLAYDAACELFQSGIIAADEVDALLFCTQSPDYVMPPNSALLHRRLRLRKSVAALDFTLACSGFIYGLALAGGLGHMMSYRTILLVTADTYSKYIHPKDRSTTTLFGDGAAATLVGQRRRNEGIIDILLGTDGAGGWDKFIIPAGGLRQPRSAVTAEPHRDVSGNERSDETIFMDGAAILDFAERDVTSAVQEILKRNGLAVTDVDLFLFHQASAYALSRLREALAIPPERSFDNLETVGNTVSASLPILLRDAEVAGKLRPDMLVLIVGFGVGYSWGCCLMRT